jgi:hypothetical protein
LLVGGGKTGAVVEQEALLPGFAFSFAGLGNGGDELRFAARLNGPLSRRSKRIVHVMENPFGLVRTQC